MRQPILELPPTVPITFLKVVPNLDSTFLANIIAPLGIVFQFQLRGINFSLLTDLTILPSLSWHGMFRFEFRVITPDSEKYWLPKYLERHYYQLQFPTKTVRGGNNDNINVNADSNPNQVSQGARAIC